MLLEVISEDYDVKDEINKACGKQFTIIERIISKNFGSFRYRLLSVSKNKFNISLEEYNDTVYLNFDLRVHGLVFYFRYKNTEYVEFCPFHSLTFQSNDNSFVIQTNACSYVFEILNQSMHNSFLSKLYKFKNKKLSVVNKG